MSTTGSITASHLAADSGALTVQIQEARGELARLRAENTTKKPAENNRIFRTSNRSQHRPLSAPKLSPSFVASSPIAEDPTDSKLGTHYEIEESIIQRRYIANPTPLAEPPQSVPNPIPAESVEIHTDRIDDLGQLAKIDPNELPTVQPENPIPAETPPSDVHHSISVQSKSYLESRFRDAYENPSDSDSPKEENLKITL